MSVALTLTTVGVCALAVIFAVIVLASCRAAALGDRQIAHDSGPLEPASPVEASLAAIGGDVRRVAALAAAVLDADLAAVLVGAADGRTRVVAAAGAPELEGRELEPDEGLLGLADEEATGPLAAAELEATRGSLVVARHDRARPLGGRDLELLGVLADVLDAAVRTPVTPELLQAVAGQVDVLSASLGPARSELRWRGGDFVRLVSAVARRVGLDGADLAETELAARLLDVGLLRVPVDVLERPGALRLSELFLVRRHAADGADVLLRVPGLAGVALLVRCHHERWDGRGYPHGLAGERIPLGARVLAACDVWWALTGDRPHAPALEPEDATAELGAAAGAQLDPAVVEALFAVLGLPAAALA